MTFAPLEVPARVGVFGVNGRVGSMFFNDTVKKTLILGGRLPGLRVFDRGRIEKKSLFPTCPFSPPSSSSHHRIHRGSRKVRRRKTTNNFSQSLKICAKI